MLKLKFRKNIKLFPNLAQNMLDYAIFLDKTLYDSQNSLLNFKIFVKYF